MNYTHCKIPADSVELTSNERPPLSLDGKWWIIRRMDFEWLEGFEGEVPTCLTLEEVRDLMQTPQWSNQDAE